MDNLLIGVVALVVFAFVILVKTAVVVDQQYEYVIERLGKYRTPWKQAFTSSSLFSTGWPINGA